MGSPVNNSRTVMVGDNLNSAVLTDAIEEIAQDTSPQLGADLDCNGYDIQFDDGTGIEDDSGNKTLIFGKTTSATTYAKITNNATGTTGPLLASAGETNVDLRLAAAGTGDIKVTTGGLRVTSDNEAISVGAGNDLALTHDGSNSTITGGVGKITVTPAAGSVLELDNSNATVDNGSVQVTGDLDVDNISIDGNTVSSTSGDLQLKAVSGSSITFQDDADATKQLTLNFATIGSGTERTWTFPNSDGTFTASAGIASLADDSSPQLGADLDCNGAQIQWSQGADVASNTALPVLTDGNYFEVTGTTTVTSINTTGGVGTQIKLHFNGALTLTHDSTDLVLPGGANILTAAGDEAEFIEYGSGDYRCTYYTKATGGPVLIPANSVDSDAYVDGSIDGVHLAVGKDGALSLNGAPADHTANGPQTTTFAAGYTTTQSDLVYLSSAGRWEEADADAAGAAAINLLGIALEVKDDGEAMNVALPGSFIQDESVFSFGSHIGKPLYMDTTDGGITVTKPTGSGDAVRTVGYAVHADMIFFNPSSDYVTLA